jgi:hypothetical protein
VKHFFSSLLRLKDCEDVELIRLRVDIQDLSLGDVSPFLTQQKETVVGLSKHLCGAATDLAIRSAHVSRIYLKPFEIVFEKFSHNLVYNTALSSPCLY